MGYGEFGGGGSVHWEVVHGDGDSATGGKHGGKGKDRHPRKGAGGVFTVKLNGITQFTAPLDDNKILVLWDLTPGATAPRTVALKAKTARPRKTYRPGKRR